MIIRGRATGSRTKQNEQMTARPVEPTHFKTGFLAAIVSVFILAASSALAQENGTASAPGAPGTPTATTSTSTPATEAQPTTSTTSPSATPPAPGTTPASPAE